MTPSVAGLGFIGDFIRALTGPFFLFFHSFLFSPLFLLCPFFCFLNVRMAVMMQLNSMSPLRPLLLLGRKWCKKKEKRGGEQKTLHSPSMRNGGVKAFGIRHAIIHSWRTLGG